MKMILNGFLSVLWPCVNDGNVIDATGGENTGLVARELATLQADLEMIEGFRSFNPNTESLEYDHRIHEAEVVCRPALTLETNNPLQSLELFTGIMKAFCRRLEGLIPVEGVEAGFLSEIVIPEGHETLMGDCLMVEFLAQFAGDANQAPLLEPLALWLEEAGRSELAKVAKGLADNYGQLLIA